MNSMHDVNITNVYEFYTCNYRGLINMLMILIMAFGMQSALQVSMNKSLVMSDARLTYLNVTISYRPAYSEYRVAPKGGNPAWRENCAYYTNDLQDAIGTMACIAKENN